MKRLAPRSLVAVVPTAVALALAAAIPAAQTAPPANDAFAAAQPITGESGSVAGTNVEATREAGEPDHTEEDSGGRSVWYRWTAPSTGLFSFDTCDASFDTVVAIYTGATLVALSRVASNDDACDVQSLVTFNATAGTVYSIAVDGFEADTGRFTLRWRVSQASGNDNFAAAQLLTGASGRIEGSNVGATREPGEQSVAGSSGASVWFRWTAPITGTAAFETCGSSFDTVLAAFTGTTVTSLSLHAANDDRCGLSSRIRFRAAAGTDYKIMVDGAEDETGLFRLAWSVATAPANDLIQNARRISGARGSLRASNAGALGQANEPRVGSYRFTASVWFRWRAPRTMGVRFQTCETTFDTVLLVYRGRIPRASNLVDANDDACGRAGSRVHFLAKRGVEYVLAVEGLLDATGTFVLAWGRPSANARCRVPDVRGMPLARARAQIEAADCRVGRVTYSRSSIVRRGRVISQSPPPGRRVRFLTPVNLEVSR